MGHLPDHYRKETGPKVQKLATPSIPARQPMSGDKDEHLQCEGYNEGPKGVWFYFTLVNGFNKAADRECLWIDMRRYAITVDGAWLVGGDFNSLMNVGERIGGANVTLVDILPMRTAIADCQLQEGKVIGSYFTWNNKHEDGTKVYSKIDRVLINDEWLQMFPDSVAHFLPEGLFYHCPCVINFTMASTKRQKSFKYFNMWALADNFEDVVSTGWQAEIQGTPMYRVTKKLKGLKHSLKQLNREQFSDIENLTHVTTIAMQKFQENLRADPLNVDLCKAERECAHDLMELTKAREMYLAQKSKENWVKERDANISFFHSSIKRRRSVNHVFQVKDASGKLSNNPEDIKVAFEQFYKSLLGNSVEVQAVNQGVIKTGRCLAAEHRDILVALVTDKEIKATMFSIPGIQASGPDAIIASSSNIADKLWG
ncbi:uncharacterized protein LOC141590547 [Silene latifolia]|uniref:uncharacterized protein LOC141590547 n=1 Tax=Silene latifolia TaxID=37657 RepID=UPI003D77BB50